LDEHLPESIETTLARPKPRQRCYVFAVLDLFEHATDFGELAAEFGAQIGQNRDERDCDQRSDQRVFDSGGARLVADERLEGLDHFFAPAPKVVIHTALHCPPSGMGTDYRPSRFPEVNSIRRSPAIRGGISTWLNSA
jgi:hypothetical protein